MSAEEIAPKEKDSLNSTPREDIAARSFRALHHRRCFYDATQDVNLPYIHITRQSTG
jgi:hypothetical protein